MLRNSKKLDTGLYDSFLLNEVLSLNAQESPVSLDGAVGTVILNEVLSLNAQEWRGPCCGRYSDSLLNEVLSLNAQEFGCVPGASGWNTPQ